jgi:hypothetical protein
VHNGRVVSLTDQEIAMSETPFESPVEDVAEQRTEVVPDESDQESTTGRWDGPRWEADPVDAQEQDAEVPIDEDEWR